MNIQAEKLELVQLLLDTNNEETLKKVRAVLSKYALRSETEYLLSTDANKSKLEQSIKDLDAGKGKRIKAEDIWK